MSTPSQRRDQIRQAATRVFAKKGYQNAVVEEVAKEAGVSKGTIYTYFDRKEELLGAVYQFLLEEMQQHQVRVMESDRSPLEKIRVLLRDFAELVGGQDELAQVILDIWVAGMQSPERFRIDFAKGYRAYRELLRSLLQEAQNRGDVSATLPDVAPAVLIGAVDGVLLQWLLDPGRVDFPDVADDILTVLYRGIKSPDAS